VLSEVRRRLLAGEPCHLATTQLVEAGVDLDFPLVLRAMGPLDRIVQAAGRCNREGKLERGKVIIFEPADGGMPPGAYKAGAANAAAMLSQIPAPDLHDPSVYTDYFGRLYHAVPLDEHDIARDRQALKFETVARNFHVIDDAGTPAAVPWRQGEALLTDIEARSGKLTRDDWRALQPYFVNLRPWEHEKAVQARRCREIAPGLWRWGEGGYDEHLGIVHDEDDLSFLYVGGGR
jgi:CRISPR-associated endonuclease/helicase Cas3